eukprot:1914333-Amphidinium_carterae.1
MLDEGSRARPIFERHHEEAPHRHLTRAADATNRDTVDCPPLSHTSSTKARKSRVKTENVTH